MSLPITRPFEVAHERLVRMRIFRTVIAAAAAVLAVAYTVPAAVGAVTPSHARMLPTPLTDPFYRPPAGFAKTAPGTVLRSRQVSVSAAVIPIPEKTYQLLFTTTDSAGRKVVTTTTVFVPMQVASGQVKNPNVLTYQPAEDSLGLACAPSTQLRSGTETDPNGIFVALAQGWVGVQTDYEGPRGAWMAGPMAGHAVLDGLRAARNFAPSMITAKSKMAGYGYSGGGHATAWAAQLENSYARDLKPRIVGWVAGDFASDVKGIFFGTQSLIRDGGLVGGFFVGAIAGIAREYPQLYGLLTPAGRAKFEQIKDMCIVALASSYPLGKIQPLINVPFASLAANRVALGVFAANTLGASGPVAPVLLQSGTNDELIPASQGIGLRKRWCARGGKVEFQSSAIPEHIVNMVGIAPGSIQWLTDRYSGIAFHSNCGN